MVVVKSLNSIIARERIGSLMQIGTLDNAIRDLLEAPDSEEGRFTYKGNSSYWDLEWEFGRNAVLPEALRNINERRAKVREGNRDAMKDISEEYFNAYNETRISEFIFAYFAEKEKAPKYEAIVEEAVLNAIEHGSLYGKNGPVKVRMYGGERGILTIVEDKGKGTILNNLSPEEIAIMTGKKQESRGHGKALYSMDSTLVGSERVRDSFQVILLYIV